MATNFLMPKLAMAMNEGTVSEWLVEEGQFINAGDPIASVETEKVSYDVESAEAGYFHILLPVGESTPVQAVIGIFAASEEEYQTIISSSGGDSAHGEEQDHGFARKQQAKPVDSATFSDFPLVTTGSGRINISPLARKMASDNSLMLAKINGTGPGGRIVKKDILVALERRSQQPGQGAAYVTSSAKELTRIAMTGARQIIAQHMRASVDTAAQVSSSWESDITDLLALRQKYVVKAEQLGTKVSVNAFLIKAICYAIKQVPVINSRLEGNELVVYENVNMGIAVAIRAQNKYDTELIVPVINNVERMGLVELGMAIKDIIQRARSGKLTADDMSDSTITLSSTAGIAPPGMKTSPILNLPNTAIVGPSTPIERPVVNSGAVVVRTMLPMSFTFDHCLMDGEPAARFMRALHDCLEEPGLMLA